MCKEWAYCDNCSCCHTEREATDQTSRFTRPQYTSTKPDSSSTVVVVVVAVVVVVVVVGWLLNVPATCECISGSDLLRQVYVLPH